MDSGQTTNSIAEAPTGLLDMDRGGSPNNSFNSLQNEFISMSAKDNNSVMGGFLHGADTAVADGLQSTDDAIAKAIGGDRAMPVSIAEPTPKDNSGLISKEGQKEFLNIPNPADDIYNSASAKDSFDRLFRSKETAA
jgi:hypothetical protein